MVGPANSREKSKTTCEITGVIRPWKEIRQWCYFGTTSRNLGCGKARDLPNPGLQGKIAVSGDGFNMLNGPYDAKVNGDYTGLTPPFFF
jgi:hypothetical protein